MKPGFQQDGAVVRSKDGLNFTLVEPITYVTAMGAVLTIPAGAATDGASTPTALWTALPPFGRYWLAAILHDWLYRNTKMGKTNCDDLLKEAMLSLGVDAVTVETIYEGVRLAGAEAFDQDRRDSAQISS